MTTGIQPLNVAIHESESLGGSDHRPVTFALSWIFSANAEFIRLDIRKLSDPMVLDLYRASIRESVSAISNG